MVRRRRDTDWAPVLGTGIGIVLIVLVVAGIVFGFGSISALILMWAWNIFIPSVFHGPVITFWQAFAASVLLTIIGAKFGIKVPDTSTKNNGYP